jgi:BlaI family penicillinase repressor
MQRPPLSAAQLELMQVVWDRGECGVADVWETLKARRPVARNTVQTMLTRLEAKGWLRHRDVQGAFLYSATAPADATRQQSLRRMLETVFQGSAVGLLQTLLEIEDLSPADVTRIRKLIREAGDRT